MLFSSKFLIPLCAAGVLVYPSGAQTPAPQAPLKARELFYAADPQQDKAPKGTTKNPANNKGTKVTGSKGTTKDGPTPKTGGAVGHGNSELPGGGHIIHAAAGPPIGITYTLQRLTAGKMVDVSPDATFHKEDRIAFVVQTNYPGYLYIGNKGTTGHWTPLFPAPEIENGDNRVEAFRKYTMPPGYRIVFDEKAGVEEVFILLSREPVPDFEKLLYPNGGAPPAMQGGKKNAPKVTLAKVDLPPDTVDRLRNTFSRDLILEKIDDDKPGDRKEKAVYIVNPTGASDSHVWADIRLVHQ